MTKFKKRILLCALFGVLSSVVAQAATIGGEADEYSPATVWTPPKGDDFSGWRTCNGNQACLIGYLKKSGASRQAIAFLEADNDGGYLSSFKEMGRVDLGVVTYPGRANTNEAYVLLNGVPPLVTTELIDSVDISRARGYSALKKKYRALEMWGAGARFVSAADTRGHGQRFVFAYELVDGCHACGTQHVAHVAFDFDRAGRFKGTKLIKLTRDAR